MQYVYVAGPISLGDQALNVRKGIAAADRLLSLGYTPYVPHLTFGWHMVSPKEYEVWMGYGMAWLEKCDAVVRLEGESRGADREVERARELGIPVYMGVEELVMEEVERRR